MEEDNVDVRRSRLRALISEAGSQRALANRLHMTPGHLSQILNGTRPFTEKSARKFERLLRLSAGWMDKPQIDSLEVASKPTNKSSENIKISNLINASHPYIEFSEMASQLSEEGRRIWRRRWEALMEAEADPPVVQRTRQRKK